MKRLMREHDEESRALVEAVNGFNRQASKRVAFLVSLEAQMQLVAARYGVRIPRNKTVLADHGARSCQEKWRSNGFFTVPEDVGIG